MPLLPGLNAHQGILWLALKYPSVSTTSLTLISRFFHLHWGLWAARLELELLETDGLELDPREPLFSSVDLDITQFQFPNYKCGWLYRLSSGVYITSVDFLAQKGLLLFKHHLQIQQLTLFYWTGNKLQLYQLITRMTFSWLLKWKKKISIISKGGGHKPPNIHSMLRL